MKILKLGIIRAGRLQLHFKKDAHLKIRSIYLMNFATERSVVNSYFWVSDFEMLWFQFTPNSYIDNFNYTYFILQLILHHTAQIRIFSTFDNSDDNDFYIPLLILSPIGFKHFTIASICKWKYIGIINDRIKDKINLHM